MGKKNKMWFIHHGDIIQPEKKKKEILQHETTWVKLSDLMLSEYYT